MRILRATPGSYFLIATPLFRSLSRDDDVDVAVAFSFTECAARVLYGVVRASRFVAVCRERVVSDLEVARGVL